MKEESRAPDADPERQTQPVDAEQPPRLPFPVVGIGASAGGLEAVGEFVDAMTPRSGMAFILVQHLPPDRESMMAEILGRRTAMPVSQVQDGMPVEPDHFYVIRPGRRLEIRDGRLHLGPPLGSPKAANRPIDDFFKSLAAEQRERAICVVMSGMGSNGAAGAQAIKAVGGLCIAQEPESAQFPSMPRHLIDAGYADYVLRPAELPDVLLAYAGHPYAHGEREADARLILEREGQHLREILAVLRTRTGKDFSGYKKPTVLRRVQRRMGLNRLADMGEYAKFLRRSPGEVTALADDLLIHVTGFFRDPESWEALRQTTVVPLVQSRKSGSSVRAWVTACSSGEEAYSLAMMLVEESERARMALDIKVFATDLADRTLAQARAGVYPGGIESEIHPERLARFFTREDEIYRVRPELRDRVVFAPQNILQDPPFSRLDIAACRNLLIYLEPAMQHRVLALLHFGLREGGTLFLGSSETVAGAEEMFEAVDKKARIFRRVGPTRHGEVEFPLPHALTAAESARRSPTLGDRTRPERDVQRGSLAELTRRTLLESHTPAAVTVDRDGRIVFYHGDTRPFLQQLTGEPTRELMLLTREGIRGATRTALSRAVATNARSTTTDGWLDQGSDRRVRVAVAASPLHSDDHAGEDGAASGYFVVTFEERGEIPAHVVEEPVGEAARAVDELRRLRAELQGTIEELQTSNEELKASHEEVMSINEEYQSANEELETSKEEMQSLNEELTTVNAQLRAKMEELQATSGDLASLLTSTDIAVLFLDMDLRIRRYTTAVRDLVDMIAGDVGRPLSALARRFDDPALDDDCRAVLEKLVPVAREVPADSGRHYLRRVLPYRTTDNRIDGVVVTFVDVTDLKRAQEALRASEDRYRRMLNIEAVGVLVFDATGTLVEANDAFLHATGFTRQEITSRALSWRSITPPEHLDESERQMERLAESGRMGPYEKELYRKDGSRAWMLLAGAALGDGTLVEYCVGVGDRKRAEEELRKSEERLRLVFASAVDYAIFTIDPDRSVTSWSTGAEAIFGYTEAEILGRPMDLLFTAEDRAAGAPEAEMAAARRDGRASDERWHVRKDGSRFYASGALTPLGERGTHGFVKVCTDLTERKRMEDDLREARDRLEENVAERTAEHVKANATLRDAMNARTELLRKLSTAQESERRRLSRELHDGLGQELTALILGLKALEHSVPEDATGRGRLREVERIVGQIGREAHDLAVELRPTALDDIGLDAALSTYVARWSERASVAVEFQPFGPESGRLAPDVETAVYRLVQEALNNVAKHAGAKRVGVMMTRYEGELIVLIEDDGRGFDSTRVDSGRENLGLLGMRERVGLVGGTLAIESVEGEGTVVRASIPLHRTSEEDHHGD